MIFEIPGVLWRRDPEGEEVPLVFDPPHSGSRYPEDFRHSWPIEVLRRAEDAFVDELYAAAPRHGATLIAALFPRSYLDANRAVDDLDEALIDGDWPSPLMPSHKTRAGLGLVRRVARPGAPIYDRKLPIGEILARVERFHAPIIASSTRRAAAPTKNSARSGMSTATRCRPTRPPSRRATAPTSCSAIATAPPAAATLPSSSPGSARPRL